MGSEDGMTVCQRDGLNLSLTPRQREAFERVLRKIASWTSSRIDQHLRYDVGDFDADCIMGWLALHDIDPVGTR